MKKNMGLADVRIRLNLAFLIAVLFLANIITGIAAIILLAMAGILLLTSLFRFCPLYLSFGITSARQGKSL